MDVGLVVPVMSNFKGFAELIRSVDIPVVPYIEDNWNDNCGVSKAWNKQIKRALDDNCDYIFVCNDDTIFAPGTMEKLIEAAPFYDLVSGINTRDFNVTERTEFVTNPDFASFLITPRTIEKFGWFDETINSYFNDNDYAYRIKLGGGHYGARLDAGFYHVGSVTQFKGKDETTNDRVVSHEEFRALQYRYVSKWGGTPGNETFTNPYANTAKTIKDW